VRQQQSTEDFSAQGQSGLLHPDGLAEREDGEVVLGRREPQGAEALAGAEPRRGVVRRSTEHDDAVGAFEVGLVIGQQAAMLRGGGRGAGGLHEQLHAEPHTVVEQGDREAAPFVRRTDQVLETLVRNRPRREAPPVGPPLAEGREEGRVDGSPGRRHPDPGEEFRARGAGHAVDRRGPAERTRCHLQVVQRRPTADDQVAAHWILGQEAARGVGVQLDGVTVDAPGPRLGVAHARGGSGVLDQSPGLGVRQTAPPRAEGGRARGHVSTIAGGWAGSQRLRSRMSRACARAREGRGEYVQDVSESPVGDSSEPIRVFLLDDHEIVRRGIRELLEGEPDIVVVGESGSAQEAARRIPALRPDVAILDGRLPDGSGVDVCREVRSRDPEIKALILTSYDDDEALFSAIMAGAAGYVLKQVRGNDLVDTVRRVAAGQSTLDPAVTAQVLERVRNGPPVDKELESLTEQELKILDLIGNGMTNREIAQEMYLAEKTVKNYVSSMLAKLGLTSRTQAAIFAVKHAQD
jgi:DNA-binding NarL/FixJ family response regulator